MIYGTESNTPETTFSIKDVEKAVELLKKLPQDPLAEWMKSKGFDPKSGGVLILPTPGKDEDEQLEWGAFGPPNYVVFSKYTVTPILLNKGYLAEIKPLKRHTIPFTGTS